MKKTTVYIIRHCESEGNAKELFYGITDCGITQKGKLQLELLKKRFHEIPLDIIYTSPLKRAKLTAEAVGDGKDIEIVTDMMLLEIDGGNLEGTNKREQQSHFPKEHSLWYSDIGNFQAPNGESTRDVYRRMKSAFLRIVSENQGKVIAITTHRCAIYMLMSFLHGYSEEEISKKAFWCDYNTGVSLVYVDKYCVNEGTIEATIAFFDDGNHLPSDYS